MKQAMAKANQTFFRVFLSMYTTNSVFLTNDYKEKGWLYKAHPEQFNTLISTFSICDS
jgi:hypothetical protein